MTDPLITAQLLRFAESVANHSSGNLHGFYGPMVQNARAVVKAAGGELQAIGRFRAGEAVPMTHAEYDRHKDDVKVARVLAALQQGPVQFISDDVYDINNKRVCTNGEMGWIRRRLERRGFKTVQHGRGALSTRELSTEQIPNSHQP